MRLSPSLQPGMQSSPLPSPCTPPLDFCCQLNCALQNSSPAAQPISVTCTSSRAADASRTSQRDRQSGVTGYPLGHCLRQHVTCDLLQDGEKRIGPRAWLSRPLWCNDVAASQTCDQVRRSSHGSSQLMLCCDSMYELFELVCDRAARL